jgi:hypothetical protein
MTAKDFSGALFLNTYHQGDSRPNATGTCIVSGKEISNRGLDEGDEVVTA